MIVLFWNVRGLGKPDTMVGAKADIVCLSETKLRAPSSQILNALGPRRIDKWFCKDAEGALGRILIGYDSSLFSLEEVWTGNFSVYGPTEELHDRLSGRRSSSLSKDGICRGLSGETSIL